MEVSIEQKFFTSIKNSYLGQKWIIIFISVDIKVDLRTLIQIR